MKILLSPPTTADSRRQPHITTVTESQLNHYIKLQAAQQQQQQLQQQQPLALLKNSSSNEDPKLSNGARPKPVVDSTSLSRPPFPALPHKTEAMPSPITSNPSAIHLQHHHLQHQQNGHHAVEGIVSAKPKFSTTTANQPPLPHKKLLMGKIEHNEALENEAAMQQHAQNLLQLSQEPLVLQNHRAPSPQPSQPHQQPPRQHVEVEPPPQSRHEELVFHQKLRDSSVGYFMEVGPTAPSIQLTASGADGDGESLFLADRQQFHNRHLVPQHFNHGLLQNRIFKDEPMSPRLVNYIGGLYNVQKITKYKM